MQIKIGENLRKLRIRNELTQEKLAEVFAVSPQAISRWENNTTYPDINILPSIANYFDISIDELLGMDEIRNTEKINLIYSKVHEHIANGLIDEAIIELRNAIKVYPNDYGFMSELALALTIQLKVDATSDALEEAIAISHRVLNNCVSDKIRSTTKANLCFLYLKANNYEAALNLTKTLPHVWESREIIMPHIVGEDNYDKELRKGVITTLDVIYSKIKERKQYKYEAGSRILALGPQNYNDVDIQKKIEVLTEFLYQIS